MPDESRILQLLEEALDSKRTPEEVCADSPELLWEVKERWERCQDVEAQIEAMFPTTGAAKNLKRCLHLPTTLPVIPGYHIDTVLGRGGMGVVYKARHLKLNRPVAIKMLLCGELAASEELTCLMREAQAVAGLTHANIVQVHDVGDLDGLPYFTMEFIEGGSLAQKLGGVPLPAREAAAMLILLARAVHAAHQGGVVHRDLKPSNILLTSDGTPKITDFGLARRLEAGAAVSMRAARVGTPSYMAPEQAMGKVGAFCPSVDIYSLGAILYEMLTGRPPFKGETASETQRQLVTEEPVPPSRLNAKVPCDLQTICLKCLRKDPERRYATAAELADDLTRFQQGLPIQARPAGWAGRLWRWGRRSPALAALLVTAVAMVALAVGGGFWMERERAIARTETARQEGRVSQAVVALLEQAAAFEEEGRWPEARAALKGAPRLLDSSAPASFRERLREARADADMVAELEEIRLRLSEGRKNETVSAGQLYAMAFRKYGLDLTVLEPAEAAARVRKSAIRDTLLAFLHDWLYWASDANRDKVRDVVERADDNQWRRAVREAMADKDVGRLKALASAPEVPAQPPVVLSGLGGILLASNQREEALAFLNEAQQRHPADFWINYLLGHFWDQERPQQAVGYFRAAVAIRPGSDQAYILLGRALSATGDADGANAALRKAIAINPNSSAARDLARVLAPRHQLEDARAVWEKALEHNPPDHDAWYGYAQLCLFLGKDEPYHRVRKAMLERFQDSADEWWAIAERTSVACLLEPVSGDELRRAVQLADEAVAAAENSPQRGNAYLRFLKGLAEYRQGRHAQAIPLLQEAAEKLPNRPGPRLVLAMAQFQSGSAKEARKTLAAAVRAYNWKESEADHPTVWVSHVLRREAEAMILPNLAAFLQGEYQPQDNDERLALLGICQFQGLYGAAAQLCADAFAADPALAEQLTEECLARAAREGQSIDQIEALNTECRYLAARCAALAGGGLGKDGARLSEAERTRLRKQAREWLRVDLAAWAKTLGSDSKPARDVAKKMLTLWQAEQDLAGIREAAALENLSAVEREECAALWNQLAVVLSRAQANK